ncbi:Bax inhibitor-1/YccA family protein [Flavobacteriales bacterium]|nr:Bax inhibitor-1/YccA family protein [Flavobacteriales bacterium]
MLKIGTKSFRSGNPALNQKTFENLSNIKDTKMTLDGTINKTTISICLLMTSAYFTYTNGILDYIIIGFVFGFVLAIVTIFKKEWSPITVPFYAVLEGLAMGGISKIYADAFSPGLIPQAITLTIAILVSLLFAYKTKIINVTENFKLGVFAATCGIAIVYVASFLMSLFGNGGLEFMDPSNSSIMSVGISLFIVIVASLNLVLDFDYIENAVKNGAPKYMEWYGAFGLLVTLIWLYMEILRLLAKLRSRGRY